MLINGINYLPLVKMGMDEPGDRCGDIHNYRARTPGEIIPGKDNINYFLEFSRCDKYNYRTENKRTGAPLKKAIRELELKNAIATDTEYTTDSGSYRNLKLENEIRKTTRPYNIESILKIVNSISKEQFTKVIFLSDVIVRDFKTGDNFTPREIMRDYA
ncbi:MAG: hypothetical protein J5662_01350, partial [Clostridia bacterium]|nr:hypothetical protein [Clostridia bacterium]